MRQAFLADEVFTGTETLKGQVLLVENNIISGIQSPGSDPSDFASENFPGCIITPAFLDLQLYGGNGKLFSHSLDTESLDATYAYCVSGGCSHFMITMATNSMENFLKGIDAAGAYLSSGKKGLLGLHLEGPWISPAKKGAHIEAFINTIALFEYQHGLIKGGSFDKSFYMCPFLCRTDPGSFQMKPQ